MTARIVVSCDGAWDNGRMPCRGAYPAATQIPVLARMEATAHGWELAGSHADLADERDLCPAHARIHSGVHSGGTT